MVGEEMIAVCGLDCAQCGIRAASLGDREAAEQLVGWWRSISILEEDEGADEVIARGPHCLECRGDRDAHWSPDCWILHCCVDEKGLDSCHLCDEFPCDRLVEWGKENEGYSAALDRLRKLQASVNPS
jgi:hypothetical protein